MQTRFLEYEPNDAATPYARRSHYGVTACVASALAFVMLAGNWLHPFDDVMLPLVVPAVLGLAGCTVVGSLLSIVLRENHRRCAWAAMILIALTAPMILAALGLSVDELLYRLANW